MDDRTVRRWTASEWSGVVLKGPVVGLRYGTPGTNRSRVVDGRLLHFRPETDVEPRHRVEIPCVLETLDQKYKSELRGVGSDVNRSRRRHKDEWQNRFRRLVQIVRF